MFKNNRTLTIIALIAVINALGYAIIIPVLYPYSVKYGLSVFQNGLLFSLFSLCQFISTPIIGRLSDKYGRRPLLIGSITGTALSFFMMAFAPHAIFLFLARALDGATAGNIPVASAVISDTTEPKDRAKGFGIIVGSFGLGFVFGPAIAALTLGFGLGVPFIIAGIVSTIGVLLTYFYLPETNTHQKEVKKAPFFDLKALALAVVDPKVGLTLLVSLLYALAFSLFIYAYQPVSSDVIGLSNVQSSINFTIFGLIGFISQMFIIPRVVPKVGEKRMLVTALGGVAIAFAGFYLARSFVAMIVVTVFMALINGFVQPLLQTLLSKEVDASSQGSIQGIFQSYFSIGFIIGPLIGGLLATQSLSLPFLGGSGFVILSVVLMARAHLVGKRAHLFH